MEEIAAFKKRPLTELLEIVLKQFKKYKTVGICQVLFDLLNMDKISNNEIMRAKNYIEYNKPKNISPLNPFWFDSREERVEFLQKLIEQSKSDQDGKAI